MPLLTSELTFRINEKSQREREAVTSRGLELRDCQQQHPSYFCDTFSLTHFLPFVNGDSHTFNDVPEFSHKITQSDSQIILADLKRKFEVLKV